MDKLQNNLDDNLDEKFSKSKCQCQFCYETHRLQLKFNHHKPTDNLQRRMKDVVFRFEKNTDNILLYNFIITFLQRKLLHD